MNTIDYFFQQWFNWKKRKRDFEKKDAVDEILVCLRDNAVSALKLKRNIDANVAYMTEVEISSCHTMIYATENTSILLYKILEYQGWRHLDYRQPFPRFIEKNKVFYTEEISGKNGFIPWLLFPVQEVQWNTEIINPLVSMDR